MRQIPCRFYVFSTNFQPKSGPRAGACQALAPGGPSRAGFDEKGPRPGPKRRPSASLWIKSWRPGGRQDLIHLPSAFGLLACQILAAWRPPGFDTLPVEHSAPVGRAQWSCGKSTVVLWEEHSPPPAAATAPLCSSYKTPTSNSPLDSQ